jgi:membrane protease YdiL (CAAX protease family)
VLVVIFVLALAALLPVGEWQGWNWTGALIYAPASGVSQELFFRVALRPGVQLALRKRARLALVGHSLLFGLWHIGPLFLGAPLWAVLAVMLVPFICGIGWGWQVQRDGTVIWAMVQHSMIWVIRLQFPMPG